MNELKLFLETRIGFMVSKDSLKPYFSSPQEVDDFLSSAKQFFSGNRDSPLRSGKWFSARGLLMFLSSEKGSCFHQNSENPKDKIGKTKPTIALVPPVAVIQESVAMELGAKKYGAYNWREHPVRASIYLSAALRHLYQYMDGENIDKESGVSHLAHVRACCGIVLDAGASKTLVDDRPLPGEAAEEIKRLTKETK